MNRRAFLVTSSAAALAACSSSALINPQVLADMQALVETAKQIIAAIVLQAPKAMSATALANAADAESAASAAIGSLSGASTAAVGASTLQVVDAKIGAVFAAVGAALPAAALAIPGLKPYVVMFDAAVALLPVAEAWINGVIGSKVATASASVTPIAATYPPAVARAALSAPAQ